MPKRSAQYLTENIVEGAIPAEKPYELRDAGQPGLILRVQPSGAKTWYVSYTINGRKTRKSIGSATRLTVKAARTKAKKPLAIAASGEDPFTKTKTSDTPLFGVYLGGAYKKYAEAHVLSHRDMLARLERNWGQLANRPLSSIGPEDVQRWRKRKMEEDEPVKFETLERELTYLKALLSTAVKEHKLIASHQLQGYTLKREAHQLTDPVNKGIRYLSESEEANLRLALMTRDEELRERRERMRDWESSRNRPLSPSICSDEYPDHLTPLVILALNTGLRQGDLFSLQWQHVDLELRQIRKVTNKGRRKNLRLRPLVMPLSNEAFEILKSWRKRSSGEGLVFPSPKTGKQLDNIQSAWENLLSAAGIKDFRFHDLRHSFASRLVVAGVPINTVRELMDHSDIRMTLVYAHLSPDHKADAVAQVFDRGAED